MTAFDLETTYLSLDGRGGVAVHAVDADFWRTIDANPSLKENLVGVYAGDADWPQWEMHPAGDEVLVLLEGRLTMLFEGPEGRESRHEMGPGATLVVPAGVWHRALIPGPTRLLAITYGAGTRHRPA
jgi:mannose-6-phosphate isomerase-like protein (cupin superfamily)